MKLTKFLMRMIMGAIGWIAGFTGMILVVVFVITTWHLAGAVVLIGIPLLYAMSGI